MSYKNVIYEKEGHLAVITLNRPEYGNAMSAELRDEVDEIWKDVKFDDEVWGVIFTGAGERHFCTGLDVGGPSPIPKKDFAEYVPWPNIPKIWKPIMVAINGVCAGGGFHFLWQSDFAICSENATFLEPHVSIGLLPVREMMGLATRAPLSVVMRMAMMGTAERVTAQQAYMWGFVTEVVPLPKLMPRARELMGKILEQAPLAVGGIKEILHRAYGLEYAHSRAMAFGNLVRPYVDLSEDAQEGMRAFAEKRKPQWTFK